MFPGARPPPPKSQQGPGRTNGIHRSLPYQQNWDGATGTACCRARVSPGELSWKAEPGGQGNAKGAKGKWQMNTWQAQKLHTGKTLLGKADAAKREDRERLREEA